MKIVEITQDKCNPIKVDARFKSVVLFQGDVFIVVEPASIPPLINELQKEIKTENNDKELLEEFLEWARENVDDVFYIFEKPEEAIEEFIKQRER